MKNSRTKAIKAGDAFYITRKECKRGHTTKRATVDGACIECRLEVQRVKRAEIRAACK